MEKLRPEPASESLIESKISDPKRLFAVHSVGLLDTPNEESFDRLTRLAAKHTDSPVTFVSLVDQDRDFYKSTYGFGEPLSSKRQLKGRTFCHYTIAIAQPLVIDDVTTHPIYGDVPTVNSLGVRAYVGIPLMTDDGYVIGSFCAIDFKPRNWTERDIDILTDLAQSTMREIDLQKLIKELDSANLLLVEEMKKVKDLNHQLEEFATTDSLTGVSNRRSFERSLEQELSLLERRPTPLSLIIADIDNFKLTNDSYGHTAGDLVLQIIATLLIKNVRNIDVVARIGGEEFAVILPDTNAESAFVVAERMRIAVANEDWENGQVTISLGIATILTAENARVFFNRADQALYKAKDSGRNRVVQA